MNKNGLQLLMDTYRKAFRIPENLNYYSEEDFQLAEKKFLKYALVDGSITIHTKNTDN